MRSTFQSMAPDMDVTKGSSKFKVSASIIINITKKPPKREQISPTPCTSVSFTLKISTADPMSVTKSSPDGRYSKDRTTLHK